MAVKLQDLQQFGNQLQELQFSQLHQSRQINRFNGSKLQGIEFLFQPALEVQTVGRTCTLEELHITEHSLQVSGTNRLRVTKC